MTPYIHDWLGFLRSSGGATSFPLFLFGAGLMAFGWRMWRVCVMLAFGAIAACVTLAYTSPSQDQLWYVGGAAIAAGALTYKPARIALALLGGLIGSGTLLFMLERTRLDPGIVWLLVATVFLMGSAYAFINRKHVIIFVTAFMGAILAMSGLAALTMLMPGLYGAVRSMASSNMIVVPFFILVPTVMGYFFQASEMHRLQAEL